MGLRIRQKEQEKEPKEEKLKFKQKKIRLEEEAKLTFLEKRRLSASVKKAKMNGKLPVSAQQTIPYQEMNKDGICQISDRIFSKTIQFYDVNYQLAQNEEKNAIFENYCDFLNYFDSSIHVQLTFLNQTADLEKYHKSIHIPEQEDSFNDIRREYTGMLKNQLDKGNNGLMKTKYVTFSIEADSIKEAKPRLERIELDVLTNFKMLGVKAQALGGYERLDILHKIFHGNDGQKFRFAWDAIVRTGLSSKDFIAPNSFEFKNARFFKIGRTYGAVSFLQILAPELTDRMLADFLDMESSQIITLHIQSIDQAKAIKMIKHKLTDIDKMKIEEQKKAVRSGYDMLRPDRV